MTDGSHEQRAYTWSRLSVFFLAQVSLFPAISLSQTTETWTANAQAKWEDANFWDEHFIPDSGTTVYIPRDGTALTYFGCTIDAVTGFATDSNLYLQASQPGPSPYTLSVRGGTLTTLNIYCWAETYNPTVYQDAGTVNVLNNLVLGRPDLTQPQSNGTYKMDGGSLVVDGNEIIGMNADDTCRYLFDASSSSYKFNWVKGSLQLEGNQGTPYSLPASRSHLNEEFRRRETRARENWIVSIPTSRAAGW